MSGDDAGILVVRPGLQDTVQDLGRPGLRRYGVTASGAMDDVALRAANLLLGNPEGAAALELTLAGPHLRFEQDTLAALTGGDLGATLAGVRLGGWRAFLVPAGSELTFAGRQSGCRAYLAVAGGIAVPPALGARSTWPGAGIGGLGGRPLRAGDRLPISASATATAVERLGGRLALAERLRFRRFPAPSVPDYPTDMRVRVVLGPQDDYFTSAAVERFLATPWLVTDRSDRMGARLSGPALEHEGPPEIVSDGIAPGSIQVPADGQPIVILRDGQTTGGYPKIATVVTADLARLAQAAPGSHVRFAPVTQDEGADALRRQLDHVRSVAQAAWRLGGP